MPIFRIKEKVLYFAHVPKAGGTSVANYLDAHCDVSAFIFGGQWKQKPRERWASTSPQHIDARSLSELFPENFFNELFSVVRHPEDRIKSEYKFRAAKSKIHALFPFSIWLRVVISASRANPYVFDGHIRPQVEFIPPKCRVFKLEEGLDDLAKWISEITGELDAVKGGFNIHANKSKKIDIELTNSDQKLIEEFYAMDFERFGYEIRREVLPISNDFGSNLLARCLGGLTFFLTRLLSFRIFY